MEHNITVGNLLSCYDIAGKIPEEILKITCGNKLYDKKYMIIKKWFLLHI
jgi:hypothetical protein